MNDSAQTARQAGEAATLAQTVQARLALESAPDLLTYAADNSLRYGRAGALTLLAVVERVAAHRILPVRQDGDRNRVPVKFHGTS